MRYEIKDGIYLTKEHVKKNWKAERNAKGIWQRDCFLEHRVNLTAVKFLHTPVSNVFEREFFYEHIWNKFFVISRCKGK